jgi:hypothetical protein
LALENLKWEQQRRKLDPSIYLVVLIMRIQFEDKAAAAAPPKRKRQNNYLFFVEAI